MTLVGEAFADTLGDFDTLPFLVGRGIDEERYGQLFDTYARSPYGLHHRQQPLRYESAFGCYGRGQMLQDLGPDVDPVQHMLATERTFVKLMRLTPDPSFMDVHLGRVTALVHDLGENTHPSLLEECGAVVGDIPQGRKTPEQRAIEMRVWDTLVRRYYQDAIPDSQIARARRLVMHQEEGSRFGLHAALETAHDLNTLRVGLRAGKLALAALEQGAVHGNRFMHLRMIGTVVTKDIRPRVEKQARSFKLPERMLDSSESLYNRIQTEL